MGQQVVIYNIFYTPNYLFIILFAYDNIPLFKFNLFNFIISDLPLVILLVLALCDAAGPLQGLVKSSDVFLHLFQQWQKDMTLPHNGGTPLSHLQTM